MPEVRDLQIVLIHMDAEIQPREGLNEGPLKQFRELYQEDPERLPPVVVFHDEDDVFWLADGHYRVMAAREALPLDGPRVLPAEVYAGTKRDAILYAAGANKHGTPLTAQEKRRVVERLLHDAEWQHMSDRDIARHCGTSNGLVSSIRKELESEAASVHGTQIPATPTRTVQRRGRSYQMKMGNIGGSARSKPTPTVMRASTAVIQDDGDHAASILASVPEELNALEEAWLQATIAERRAFFEWVLKRPVNELCPDMSPDDTHRILDVIVEVCRTVHMA